MGRVIEVVEYDPRWPRMYEVEAAQLKGVFGAELVSIHHVGSTSVIGLRAKPVIDILVLIRDIALVDSFNAPMETLGYRARGECLDAPVPGTPGRFYFSKDTRGVRTHQVHVCEVGHWDAEDKLAFRDYLREHPQVAAEYAKIKDEGAGLNRQDIIGYMRHKDAFIKRAVCEARKLS